MKRHLLITLILTVLLAETVLADPTPWRPWPWNFSYVKEVLQDPGYYAWTTYTNLLGSWFWFIPYFVMIIALYLKFEDFSIAAFISSIAYIVLGFTLAPQLSGIMWVMVVIAVLSFLYRVVYGPK